jgi:hypothetical protein
MLVSPTIRGRSFGQLMRDYERLGNVGRLGLMSHHSSSVAKACLELGWHKSRKSRVPRGLSGTRLLGKSALFYNRLRFRGGCCGTTQMTVSCTGRLQRGCRNLSSGGTLTNLVLCEARGLIGLPHCVRLIFKRSPQNAIYWC